MTRSAALLALITTAVLATPGAPVAGARPAPEIEGTIVYTACEGERDGYGCLLPPTDQVPAEQAAMHTGPEIFLRTSGGGTHRSTFNQANEWGLEFSPSGDTVAFSTGRDTCNAYTMPLEGGPVVQLTPGREDVCVVVDDWSSDGEWILLTHYWSDAAEVYKVRPDGSDLTHLLSTMHEDTGVWDAHWVNGTQQIVMDATVLMENDRYVDGIYTMDANGDDFCLLSRMKVLTLEAAPDGNSIFVSTYRKPRKHGEIYELNLDGEIIRRLTDNNRDEEALTFSPAGSKLLFTVRDMWSQVYWRNAEPEDFAVYGRVLDLRSGRIEPLRLPDGVKLSEDYLPSWAWSPDGTKVALSTEEQDSTQRIVWTSVERRAFGELVPEGPQVSLYGWLP